MKHEYVEKKFRSSSLELIDQANTIIETFAADGYDLTLRQLYYQFVAQDRFPDDRRWTWTGSRWVKDPNGTKNADPNYKWLGGIINDGRLAGLVDWDSIIDRTRTYEALPHWEDPGGVLETAARMYRIDTRADQDNYLEVWVEKDALVGIVEQACRPLDVGYMSCRGYVSQSAMWLAAERFLVHDRQEKPTYLIHLGDHDPSGIDMTRDIQDRLDMFYSNVEVQRIALTMEQIEQYNPPPNPAKTTDSRYEPYIRKYGTDSWELDALDPHVLTELITDAVEAHTDHGRMNARLKQQESDREKIQELSDNWEG